MKAKKKVFQVTSSGRDEYPGDGLRLDKDVDKRFLDHLGLEVNLGDEVEVTARIVSRIETKRKKV